MSAAASRPSRPLCSENGLLPTVPAANPVAQSEFGCRGSMGPPGFRPPRKYHTEAVAGMPIGMPHPCANGTERGICKGAGALLSGDGSGPAWAVTDGRGHRSRPSRVSALRRAALHARPHCRQLRLQRRHSDRAVTRWPPPTGSRRLASGLLGRVEVAACRTPRHRKLVRLRGSDDGCLCRPLWFRLGGGDQLLIIGPRVRPRGRGCRCRP